jgi:hypothetical protein
LEGSLRKQRVFVIENFITFCYETNKLSTRSARTDVKVPTVNSEMAKGKLSYSGARLFNSLPVEMKDITNLSLTSFKNKF